MVVEDDDAVAMALVDAVNAAGHDAVRVARGADALLQHQQAQMILLDLGLPDMDGLEVLRKLRQVTGVPIVILTARNDERSVVRGRPGRAAGPHRGRRPPLQGGGAGG